MEHNLNLEWGTYPLQKTTLLKIADVDRNKSESDVEFNSHIKINSRRKDCLPEYGLFNDILNTDSITEIDCTYDNPTKEDDIPDTEPDLILIEEDAPSISDQIIDCINEENSNIPKVISLLSKVKESCLSKVLLDAWNQLPKTDQPGKIRAFIVALSSTSESRKTLCSDVLYPWIQKPKSFYIALQIMEPVIHWLDNEISHLFIPLIANENALFIKDDLAFRHFHSSLSLSQKHHALSTFLSVYGAIIAKWQYGVFSLMVDNTFLDDKLLLQMVVVLNSAPDHETDRNIGKIMLKMAEELSPRNPKQLIQSVTSLCDGFKGLLRFRIKKILDNLKSST